MELREKNDKQVRVEFNQVGDNKSFTVYQTTVDEVYTFLKKEMESLTKEITIQHTAIQKPSQHFVKSTFAVSECSTEKTIENKNKPVRKNSKSTTIYGFTATEVYDYFLQAIKNRTKKNNDGLL